MYGTCVNAHCAKRAGGRSPNTGVCEKYVIIIIIMIIIIISSGGSGSGGGSGSSSGSGSGSSSGSSCRCCSIETLRLCEPWPCISSAETALQPLIWCCKNL